MSKNKVIQTNNNLDIQNKIYTIRNKQVMIDKDLAFLYGVETRILNQAVKRNMERFPEDFMFQLKEEELSNLMSQNEISSWSGELENFMPNKNCSKSQIVILNNTMLQPNENNTSNLISQNVISSWGGDRKLPYAFTENGIAMLSGVLRSETAIKANIQIMRTFTQMRRFLITNAQVFNRLDKIETHQLESDKKIEELFTKMETHGVERRQGIFFQGQIFDSYAFFEKLIQNAKKEIILIDGYVDLTVLERLSKKKKNVNVTIYTHSKTPLSNLDVQKFNAQYPTLTLKTTTKIHDRFLIIDNRELYHLGASLKDLGAKCFAFEKMEDEKILIPELLKNV